MLLYDPFDIFCMLIRIPWFLQEYILQVYYVDIVVVYTLILLQIRNLSASTETFLLTTEFSFQELCFTQSYYYAKHPLSMRSIWLSVLRTIAHKYRNSPYLIEAYVIPQKPGFADFILVDQIQETYIIHIDKYSISQNHVIPHIKDLSKTIIYMYVIGIEPNCYKL